ncbi:MAG: SIS domain-containing protein [Chthoniobacteraceae bacterium]
MKTFSSHAAEYLQRLQTLLAQMEPAVLETIAAELVRAYKDDANIYVVGNGGSASTASHMSCDLSKGTLSPAHRRLRVVSLTDNMAWFSAIANDFGYEEVFVEQLRTIIRPGDLVISISASGNSPNVVKAVQFAKDKGVKTISLLGFKGGKLKEISDIVLHLEGTDYGTIEDAHLILNHMLVEYMRDYIHSQEGAAQ